MCICNVLRFVSLVGGVLEKNMKRHNVSHFVAKLARINLYSFDL